jgi:hypothetical protein
MTMRPLGYSNAIAFYAKAFGRRGVPHRRAEAYSRQSVMFIPAMVDQPGSNWALGNQHSLASMIGLRWPLARDDEGGPTVSRAKRDWLGHPGFTRGSPNFAFRPSRISLSLG